MKRNIFLFTALLAISSFSYGQTNDDGLVTSRLSIASATQEKMAFFISEFKSGIDKVKNGELQSDVAVTSFYQVDVSAFPKIEQVLANSVNQPTSTDYSTGFLEKLSEAIKKADVLTTTISDVRNAFANIAISSNLSVKESEALAAIDLCTQELVRSYSLDVAASSSLGHLDDFSFTNSFADNFDKSLFQTEKNTLELIRLPRWVRCGLGTIGSAVLGGFQGFVAGIRFGHLGGAIGGVGGVIAGTFTGVARYCD